MRNTPWMGRKFWLNAGLSLSVAGMPWTAAISLLGTSTIATLTATPVQAAMLSGWEFDPSTQELVVTVLGGTTPRYYLAAEPARIILDLPDTEIGTVPLQQTYGGAIREIRVAQFEAGVTRIVLELAPGTVLAPGHVDLQQAGGGDRWVLRPLLATNATVATATPSTPSPASESAASDATSPTVELPPLEPGATEIPVEQPPSAAITPPATSEPSVPANVGTETAGITTGEASAQVSPQITVPAPPENSSENPSEPSAEVSPNETTQPESVRMPFAETAQTETNRMSSPEDIAETESSSQPSAAESTSPTLPQVSANTFPTPSIAGTVSVPPVETVPQESVNAQPAPLTPTRPQAAPSSPVAPPPANFPPPAIPSASSSATANSVAPANSSPLPASSSPEPTPESGPESSPEAASTHSAPSVPTPSAPTAIASSSNRAIDFGQPLPKSASNSLPGSASGNSIAYSSGNSIFLPSGTTLKMRYPGEEPLDLSSGESRQEVLVLAEPVLDEAGNVVLPEGSPVVGRFETGEAGNQFIAQAISLQGQTIILNAQSDPVSGEHPSQRRLLRNSALGLAAGVALGITGIGLIPAIAAGAATAAGITFLPNSHPDVIQPDQVLEVRLMQDLTGVN